MRKVLYVLLAIALIFIFEALTSWIRAYNAPLDIWISFVKYLITSIIIYLYQRSWYRYFIWAVVILLVLQFTTILIDYNSEKIMSIGAIAFSYSLLGFIVGMLWNSQHIHRRWKMASIAIATIITSLAYYYYFNLRSLYTTGNFTGKVSIPAPRTLRAVDDRGAPV